MPGPWEDYQSGDTATIDADAQGPWSDFEPGVVPPVQGPDLSRIKLTPYETPSGTQIPQAPRLPAGATLADVVSQPMPRFGDQPVFDPAQSRTVDLVPPDGPLSAPLPMPTMPSEFGRGIVIPPAEKVRIEEDIASPYLKLPTAPSVEEAPALPFEPGASMGPLGVQVARTLYNVAKSVPEFASSEQGMLAGLASLTPLGRAGVEAYFTADMAKSVLDQAKQAGEDWDKMSLPQKASAITQAIATLGFTGLLAKAGIGSARKALPKMPGPKPEFQGPLATGEVLQMPKGSAVPPKVPFNLPDAAAPEPPVVPPKAETLAVPVEETLTPALLVGDKPISGGKSHDQVLQSNLMKVDDPIALMDAHKDDAKHVFIHQKPDGTTETLTREAAGPVYDRLWGNKPETTKSLESAMLEEPKKSASAPESIKGGAESGLSPEAQARSRANNSRAAFEALQKAEDAKKAAAAAPPPAAAPEKAAPPPASSTGLSAPVDISQEPKPAAPEKGKIDDWITKLESLKSKGGEAGLASFPDPEVFKGIGSALRNTAIDVAIGVLKAGKSIGEALDAAMAHIRERSKDFDETKLRAALGAYLNPPETTGIAHRVSEARGMAPERGKGVAPSESVEHGRELLQQGLDPQSVLDVFNKTQAVRADDMAVVRAHLERLSKATNDAADGPGIDSPEYKAAWEAEKDWRAKVKPMQTEWHRIGQAQKGETDVDTGTFTGLQRLHQENTGTDFTPGQKKQGQRIAKTNKDAQEATGEAHQKFNQHIRDKSTGGIPDAEQRAFDAANKTVREWAIKVAEAENKSRIAKTVQEREVAKIQEARVRKGLEEAQQNARDAAVKMADAENKARVDAAAKERSDAVQLKATQDALDAANKTVRENAARVAEAENKARSAQAGRDKAAARVQLKAEKKALDAANKVVTKAAADLAAKERKLQGDPTLRVWTKAKEYLDQGIDKLDDIRKKLATDLGMSIEQVTRLMAQDKRAKYLADEVWRRQQVERNLKSQAKRWVQNLSTPGYIKALQSIPRGMFVLKVGLHGTVALGTHAPTVAFQPRFWGAYVRNFGKMYHMVGSRAYYESQVQNLLRADNYTTARRAGLINDPFVNEEYAMNPVVGGVAKIAPKVADAINKMTGMGNRGYSVLKMLRQDMFDQHWNQLPKSMQIPEIAQAIADGVNHATGVVQGMAPKGTNLALFAPRLEASRVMWLAGDPGKAVGTLLNWKNASQGDKYFAVNQLKEKAWVVGTLGSLLALNQGILSASGSDQQVNVTNPFKSDFLKFKAAGMNVSYGNPMITMARLPLRLFVGVVNEGKLNKIVYEDERVATILFEYVRSQMSPFAGTATDLAIGRDFMERPLPRAGFGLIPGKTNIPKRLKAEGIQPYTWKEYAAQQAAMIPLQEALKEVWGKDLMMTPEARRHALDALATIIVMVGTGARVSEDYSLKPKPAAPPPPWEQFAPR